MHRFADNPSLMNPRRRLCVGQSIDLDVSAAERRGAGACRSTASGSSAIKRGEWRTIEVPGVWQAQFADLRLTGGSAIYKRRLQPRRMAQSRNEAVLHFEAVNYFSDVYLNGQHLGSHEGGWLPFEFGVRSQGAEGR